MDALTYIATKYDLTLSQRQQPIEIPNTNRESLARLFFLLEFRKGAEIGVERGLYSEVLCKQNPGLQLACVDAWKPYRGYRDHVGGDKLQRFYEETLDRLAPYPRARTLRKWSVEAAADFQNGELDFVYIDANHRLEAVIADLAAWAPKVRAGGIVAGHDYIRCKLPSLMHVPQAIHAWIDAYEIAPLFVLGRKEKNAGELRDDGRSWFYVQPAPAPKPEKVIKQ